jgi:hypothetical protein
LGAGLRRAGAALTHGRVVAAGPAVVARGVYGAEVHADDVVAAAAQGRGPGGERKERDETDPVPSHARGA